MTNKKNKRKKIFLRIIKWGAIVIFSYWFISTLIMGHTKFNSRKGIIEYGWSGFDALFTDEDFGFSKNKILKTKLDGVDGPYIFDENKFSVNEASELIKENFDPTQPLIVKVNNKDKDSFQLTLKNSHQQEADNYELPTKLISISDIEGNFNAFYSFLKANKVIDDNYNWIYGDGHLVLNGDFFDRGKNVRQVLWLIYLLEEKAEKQGGKVHFINGNHEIMNLAGDVSYAKTKYKEIAKQISNEQDWDKASRYLYSGKSEIGKWLRTKNVAEKIGKYVFVHGGLNKKLISEEISIADMNNISRKYYGQYLEKSPEIFKEKLVIHPFYSPYWDRSLSMNMAYKTMFFISDPVNAPTHKPSESELEEVLNFYNAEKIIIGHSVVDNVSFDYNGKVIKIDVKHGLEKNSSKTQGLLIENGIEYKVNGLGEREQLK